MTNISKQDGRMGSEPVTVSTESYGSLTIGVRRIDESLPLPKYETEGAAGMDLYSRTDMEVGPFERVIVPANIVIQLPAGYQAEIRPRSGTSKKTPLLIPNAPGTIDSDYAGDKDEVGIIVLNLSNEPFKINRGDRIAQMVITRYERVKLDESVFTSKENRGGFGSTGGKI